MSIFARKESDTAEINRRQQSGEANSTKIGFCEICRNSETKDARQDQHYRQGRSFAAVTIAPETNPEIRNHEQEKNPKEHRAFCSSKDETPPAVQPDRRSN